MVIAALGRSSTFKYTPRSLLRHDRTGAKSRGRSHPYRLLEGIAGSDGAVLEPALEPLHALGRTSVSEGFGIHSSASHALQPVVSHRGRSFQPFVDVTGIQDVTLLRGVAPNAGQTIGLQFESDRKLVRSLRVLLLRATHFGLDAQQLLHVVANLVGQ